VRCLLTQHERPSTDCATGELVTVGQRPAFFLDDVSPWPVFKSLVALWIMGWRTALEPFHYWMVGYEYRTSLSSWFNVFTLIELGHGSGGFIGF
jgi:hypothetical protein